jgi:heterodisulfide reductase subunit C
MLDSLFQPHRLLHLISIGATDKVLKSDGLWKCTTCFTCTERCPQGIRVTEILWIARAMAVQSGHGHELLINQRDVLLRTGRLIPMDNKKREKSGLVAMQEESPVVAQIFRITEGEK